MGAVYAGEEFRAAVSVSSALDIPVSAVVVKLELQSGARRWPLVDTADASTSAATVELLAAFPTDGHVSFVVSHPLVESGLHCLVASITYIPSGANTAAAPLSYAKFFKFNVLAPFTVACGVHAREELLWAEVAVTNATQRQVHLTGVDIVTTGDTDSEQWQVFPVGSSADTSEGEEEEGGGDAGSEDASLGALPVSSTRVFLFRVEHDRHADDSRAVGEIGRVSIGWRGYMGERCHLPLACIVHRTLRTTSALLTLPTPAASPPTPPLSLQLLSCPASAVLERPFTVRVAVINPHPFALQRTALWLMREKMGSVLPMGHSRFTIGRIEGKGRVELDLRLMGIGLGLQKISGLRLTASPDRQGSGGDAHGAWGSPVMQADFDGLHQMEILAA